MMAALALTFAACSSDDNEILPPEQPQQAGGIPFTATISVGEGATTRALSESGTTLEATWAVGEKVALIHNGVSDEMTVSTVNEGVATITGTITGSPSGGDDVTIIYPSDASDGATGNVKSDWLYAQTGGTLSDVASKYDVRKGSGTLAVSGGAASLSGNVSLANQNAIFKFIVQDLSGNAKSASEFKVSNALGDVLTTVTLVSATSELYVALPALPAGTYWFSATAGSKPYIAKATVSTATTAGNYYQSTVKMATLGDLMAADGKFYADAAAITAASTTAIGVIAHLGNDACTETIANGGGHGLVLCLKNAASNIAWSTDKSSQAYTGNAFVTNADGLKRSDGVSGYSATAALASATDASTVYPAAYQAQHYTTLPAPTAGTTGWFLPSAQQWVKMQTGLGALDESSITWLSWFDNSHTAADKWEAALSKAGSGNYDSMTSAYLWYLSSSECSAYSAVYLSVATDTGDAYGFEWLYFNKDVTVSSNRVRPVLAF